MAFRRRALTFFVAVALLTVLAAGAAGAAQPIREPLVIEDAEFNNLCPFPVLLEITANKEYVKVFSDGRFFVNGKLFVRITNLDSGESLDANVSGPAHITLLSERGAGRGIFLLFPEDVGGPGIILGTGRVDIVRDEDGFITGLDIRGTTFDVCAALA
jgi:hypothetical protein